MALPSTSTSAVLAQQLHEEFEAIASRHHSELQRCLSDAAARLPSRCGSQDSEVVPLEQGPIRPHHPHSESHVMPPPEPAPDLPTMSSLFYAPIGKAAVRARTHDLLLPFAQRTAGAVSCKEMLRSESVPSSPVVPPELVPQAVHCASPSAALENYAFNHFMLPGGLGGGEKSSGTHMALWGDRTGTNMISEGESRLAGDTDSESGQADNGREGPQISSECMATKVGIQAKSSELGSSVFGPSRTAAAERVNRMKTEWSRIRGQSKFQKKGNGAPTVSIIADKFHADHYLTERMRRHAESKESFLEALVTSRNYEWVSLTLVVVNAFLIGYEVDYMSVRAEKDSSEGRTVQTGVPMGFIVLNVLFCVLFAIDLALRWVADGPITFFMTPEWHWNLFDVCVVSSAILEVIFQLSGTEKSIFVSLAMLRVLRVVRVIKIVRILRVVNAFRELRIMLYSILSSIRSLVWTSLVFSLVLFIFGVALTAGAYDHLKDNNGWADPNVSNLRHDFGNLSQSIISLYLGMSGGKDWGELLESLGPVSMYYRIVFVFFMTFAIFAVVNVVTGVFVESALRTSERDRDFLMQETARQKEAYVASMYELFREMDTDHTGAVSWQEFDDHLKDERVMNYLKALKIETFEVRSLFTLLDVDQSGVVEIDEFLLGCERLKGEAKALDLAILRHEVRHLAQALFAFAGVGTPTSPMLQMDASLSQSKDAINA